MSRGFLLTLGLFVIALVSFVLGCGQPFVLLFYLFVGWGLYLFRVLPQVEVPLDSVAVAVVSIAGIAVLFHLTGRWLWNAIKRNDLPRWQLRYTATAVLGIVLLFACGMAATGAAHQVGWMTQDPGPMWVLRRRATTQRILTASDLRQIGQTLHFYIEEHDDQLPKSLDALLAYEPALSSHARGHLGLPFISYFDGLDQLPAGDVPIVGEPLANNDGEGANILFANGDVLFVNAEDIADVLRRRPR